MMYPDGIKAMRERFKTLAEFDAFGSSGRVAMAMGVDHSDAHLYRKELAEKEREENTLKRTPEMQKKLDKMAAEVKTKADFKYRFHGSVNGLMKHYGVSWPDANRHAKNLPDGPLTQIDDAPEPAQAEPVSAQVENVITEPENVSTEAENVTDQPESPVSEDPDPQAEPIAETPAPISAEIPRLPKDASREDLAKDLLTAVETLMSQHNVKAINGYFSAIKQQHETAIETAVSPAEQLLHQRDLEIIKQVETGLLTALGTVQ